MFWRDCIRECNQRITISYASRDETWDIGGWAVGIVFGIQYERIMSGAEIKRVYVFNDKKEHDHFLDVMEKQIQMGCGIKYIYKKDFLEPSFVSVNIAIVETFNFALANDS